jgi:hypothetical protein
MVKDNQWNRFPKKRICGADFVGAQIPKKKPGLSMFSLGSFLNAEKNQLPKKHV